MQINLLKKVVERAAGVQAVKIIDLLYNKKNVNEFMIAKKLGVTINQTRNLLYRLSHLGIISSIRKKDKRKGWYIYFWTVNILKSLEILEESIKQEIHQLEGQLASKKTKRFYKCPICSLEVSEETALLTNFICSECGEVYVLVNNPPIIEELSKNIEKLQRELNGVQHEIRIEEEKKNKKLNRFIKREEKKKKVLRDNKRKAKKAENLRIKGKRKNKKKKKL